MSNFLPYGGGFDVGESRRRLDEIERQISAPGPWDEPERLTPVLQEKGRLENELERFSSLERARQDVEDWLALSEEEET